jgi:glycine/D-amino acid oxidase-like deaminating enzyme
MLTGTHWDVVVIGAGSAGAVVAARCRRIPSVACFCWRPHAIGARRSSAGDA